MTHTVDLLLEQSEEVQTAQEVDLYFILCIPFITFVLCGPIVFILLLCYIQQRNKKLQRVDLEGLQKRRFSTQSGISGGVKFGGTLPRSGYLRSSPSPRMNSMVIAEGAK